MFCSKKVHLVFVGFMFLNIFTLLGLSVEEMRLLAEAKGAYYNYLLDDYLKMTPVQRAQKEQSQLKSLKAAVTAALQSPDLNEPESLLAVMLS